MTQERSSLDVADDYRDSHATRGGNYDKILAETPFDAYMASFEDEYLRKIVPEYFPDGVPRYLDFACGTARITSTVSAFARESYGVDISASMLEQARRKCPHVRFVHADITREAPQLGKFSLVTSFRFFGNAQQELRQAVLKPLSDMLEPGGLLIINSHRNPNAIATLLGSLTGLKHDLDLTYPKLTSLLASFGLKIIHTRPVGFWIYRARMMGDVRYPSPKALRLEARFSSSFWTPWAPDAIVVARKQS